MTTTHTYAPVHGGYPGVVQTPSSQASICQNCKGYGETAVPGTYGLTISPEVLETVPCGVCGGAGELPTQDALDRERAIMDDHDPLLRSWPVADEDRDFRHPWPEALVYGEED